MSPMDRALRQKPVGHSPFEEASQHICHAIETRLSSITVTEALMKCFKISLTNAYTLRVRTEYNWYLSDT